MSNGETRGTVGPNSCCAAALTRAVAMEGALDALAVGIAFLDRQGGVVHANSESQRILDENDGLRLSASGRFGCSEGCEEKKIDQLVRNIAKGQKDGGIVAISRPSGKRSYTVSFTPVAANPSMSELVESCPQIKTVAMICDPEHKSRCVCQRLQQVYNLTPSESKLALELAHGNSLEESADELGITKNTARTLLQRAFSKTNTCRQGELIALIRGNLTLSATAPAQ